jgi:hypothetical protein
MPNVTFSFLLLSFPYALFAQAPRFPKPNPEHAYPDLKVYDNAGSPVRKPAEDWEGARIRAAQDPAWKSWLNGQQAEVDDWMAKRKDRVEWIAGWWHDFVSPKDGSFLTFTPDPPGEESLFSPSDAQVRLTPKIMGGWVFGFRSRHTEKMVEAAMLWRLTGERRYLDWVVTQFDFYAANLAKWPIQTAKAKSRLMHQSLDDANVLVRHVRAARLIQAATSEEQQRRWFRELLLPQAELLDETMQRIHNIACWQRVAMAMAALYGKDDSLWKRATDGPFGIRRQIADGVTGDYLWFEQSLGYNSYVVSALYPLFEYAALEGRMDALRHEMAVAQNLMLAPVYMRFPDGHLPNPADATGGRPRVSNRSFVSTYRIFPTVPGLHAAAAEKSWSTLIDPPLAPARPATLPEVASRNLESSRMAILKRGGWQLYFHYGQLDASHSQAEALNFEAVYQGTDITHDPGTVGYGSPLHAGFYKTALAHNVPVIDRRGQEGWQAGELLSFDAEAGKVSAAQPHYAKNTRATRTLEISGEQLTDVVKVVSTSGAAGLVLHLQGEIELPAGFSDAPCPQFWTSCKSFDAGQSASFLVRFPNRLMRVKLRASAPMKITQGNSPDAPPARRDSLFIETAVSEASFTTTIRPNP